MTPEFLSKLKRTVSEAKIYTVLVRSIHGSVLHLGIHFSLDEAYAAARDKIQTMAPHGPNEAVDMELWTSAPARQVLAQFIEPAAVDELFKQEQKPPTGVPVGTVIVHGTGEMPPLLKALLNSTHKQEASTALPQSQTENRTKTTTLRDNVQKIRESRSELMKKLIEQGDLAMVDKFKELLGSRSIRYVKQAIADKNLKITEVTPGTSSAPVEGINNKENKL